MDETRRHPSGFTLVEIMVSIVLLAVIMAIALPVFSKIHTTANETYVIEAMRAIVQSCESYQLNQQRYPGTLQLLLNANPPYLDDRFRIIALAGMGAAPTVRGYVWDYQMRQAAVVAATQSGNILHPAPGSFALRAVPQVRGVTGTRSFYADESGVVRFNRVGVAGPNDPPLE